MVGACRWSRRCRRRRVPRPPRRGGTRGGIARSLTVLQALGEGIREAGGADRGRGAVDVVAGALPGGGLGGGVEQQPRGARIAVARLADGPRVDEPFAARDRAPPASSRPRSRRRARTPRATGRRSRRGRGCRRARRRSARGRARSSRSDRRRSRRRRRGTRPPPPGRRQCPPAPLERRADWRGCRRRSRPASIFTCTVRERWKQSAAVVAAIAVAEAAAMLLRPRTGLVDPAPVKAASYFSPAEIERARAFRRPQLALFGGMLTAQGAALA